MIGAVNSKKQGVAILAVCISVGVWTLAPSKAANAGVTMVAQEKYQPLPSIIMQPDSAKKEPIADLVDEEAYFPGGYEVYFANNFRMPRKARKNGVKGVCIVSFVVDKEGLLSDINVRQSVSPEVDREIIRVLESMPAWRAGKVDGKPVKSRHQLTINLR